MIETYAKYVEEYYLKEMKPKGISSITIAKRVLIWREMLLSGITLNQIDSPIPDLKQTMLCKNDKFSNMNGVLSLLVARRTLADLIPCVNCILYKLLAVEIERNPTASTVLTNGLS